MNDRFKFRAWWYGQKRMDYVGFKELRNYSFPLDWCNIMQCTGLKDKNGKLIFEGDILSVMSDWEHTQNKELRTVVGWNDVTGGWFCDCEATDCGGDMEEWDDAEIIGNIYENPELLKELSQ